MIESFSTTSLERAERVVDLAIEAQQKEVESLPTKIGEFSETELLPDRIELILQSDHENTPARNVTKFEQSNETDSPNPKGGSYKDVKVDGEGDVYEVHHMPADSASSLDRGDGPAIKMEKEDHRKTASCGMSREAREYREIQKELIEEGRFREALQMDIDDIRENFGDKYDEAIEEMLAYVDQLEAEGRI